MKEYYESLDRALIAYVGGDEKPFERHCIKFQVGSLPKDPTTRTCGVMKAIANRETLPEECREKAVEWLNSRGFSTSLH